MLLLHHFRGASGLDLSDALNRADGDGGGADGDDGDVAVGPARVVELLSWQDGFEVPLHGLTSHSCHRQGAVEATTRWLGVAYHPCEKRLERSGARGGRPPCVEADGDEGHQDGVRHPYEAVV